ncbi:MAG: GDP-mannose 4,6-dehydratase, partial [Candidatus Omnitrophica bacterium]|nr:GDP-mannose 4,6-dehydratase [Candidatus Omnitrophota bacterium]
ARETRVKSKILSVGSSEQYGIVSRGSLPLVEKSPLNPISPYAVARVAQEEMSIIYTRGYNIPIICTRSFNHIGPRQSDVFAVSSFAKQIVEGRKGKRDKIICGNLDVVRDFIDVRDAVCAYDLLLHKGKPGDVYNICSGRGHKLSDVLGLLQKIGVTRMPVEVNSALIRPMDNPIIIGSCAKLKKDTGFKAKYDISVSLGDMIDYWEEQLS